MIEILLVAAGWALIGGVALIHKLKKEDEKKGVYKHWWEY